MLSFFKAYLQDRKWRKKLRNAGKAIPVLSQIALENRSRFFVIERFPCACGYELVIPHWGREFIACPNCGYHHRSYLAVRLELHKAEVGE